MTTYRVGSVEFSIRGPDEYLRLLGSRLQPYQQPVNEPSEISIVERLPSRATHTEVVHGWRVQADSRSGSLLACPVPPRRWAAHLPDRLHRLAHPAHLTAREYSTSLFVSEVLEGWLHSVGLPQGQLLMPGLALAGPGGATVVAAAGAMGKTGAALRLVSGNTGWKYIADDAFFINRHGLCIGAIQKVSLATRNLSHPSSLLTLQKMLQRSDRLAWALHNRLKTRGLRRDLEASLLFGPEKLARRTQLRHLIILKRSSQVVKAEIATLGESAALRDLERLIEHETKHSLRIEDEPNEERSYIVDILRSLIAKTPTRHLLVPSGMDESEIENVLVEVVISSDQ